jgi:hypothetical protein
MWCPKWLKRAVLSWQLASVKRDLAAEEWDQEIHLVDRWDALEQQNAPAYDMYTNLHCASRRAVRQLQTRRDEITSQLESLKTK